MLIFAGGYTTGVLRSVRVWNPEDETWDLVGDMIRPRYRHAASIVPADVSKYCLE